MMLLTMVLVVGVLAAACGSDDDSDDEEARQTETAEAQTPGATDEGTPGTPDGTAEANGDGTGAGNGNGTGTGDGDGNGGEGDSDGGENGGGGSGDPSQPGEELLPGTAMHLTVTSGGTCQGNECSVNTGATFTVEVQLTEIPDDGYILMQTFIDHGDLTYLPTDEAFDEMVWSDAEEGTTVRSQELAPGTVLHGSITGLTPPLPASRQTGTMVRIQLRCPNSPTTVPVELVGYNEGVAGTSGSLLIEADGVTRYLPELGSINVNCG